MNATMPQSSPTTLKDEEIRTVESTSSDLPSKSTQFGNGVDSYGENNGQHQQHNISFDRRR